MTTSLVSGNAASRSRAVVFIAALVAAALIAALSGISWKSAIIGSANSSTDWYYWESWWFSTTLQHAGQFPLKTTMINYPDGGTLLPASPLNYLAMSLLSAIVPRTVAYNAVLCLEMALMAVGLFGVAARLLGSYAAAAIASLIYVFSPWMLSLGLASGDLMILSSGWGLLALGTLWEGIQDRRTFTVFKAAIYFLVLGYAAPPVGWLALLMSPFVIVGPALLKLRAGHDEQRQGGGAKALGILGRYGLWLALGLALWLPYLVILISMADDPASLLYGNEITLSPTPLRPDSIREYYRSPFFVSLMDYVRLPKAADAVLPMGRIYTQSVFPGFVAAALLIVALFVLRRSGRWFALLSGGMFFSLGPLFAVSPSSRLFLSGAPHYWLLDHLQPPGILIQPAYFIAATMAGVALAAGEGYLALARAVRRWDKTGNALPAACLGLFCIETAIAGRILVKGAFSPLPALKTESWANAECRGDGVLELPFFVRDSSAYSSHALLAQTVHGKPLFNSCRPKLGHRAMQNAFVRLLIEVEAPELMQMSQQMPQPQEIKEGIEKLGEDGICCLLIYEPLYRQGAKEQLMALMKKYLSDFEAVGDGFLLVRLYAQKTAAVNPIASTIGAQQNVADTPGASYAGPSPTEPR